MTRFRPLVIVLAGLAIFTITMPSLALAGNFWGYIEVRVTNPPGYPGPFTIVETNYSKVSPLGRVGGWMTVNVAPDGSRSGKVFLRGDKGTLSLTYKDVVGMGRENAGTFTIDEGSGTGKYTKATGSGTIFQHWSPKLDGTVVINTGIDGRISF